MNTEIESIFNTELENGYITFYHGSPATEEILYGNGLRGGDNTNGGDRIKWENPILFLAYNPHVASQYGQVLKIELPLSFCKKLMQNEDLIILPVVDGLGDGCLTIEDEIGDFYIPPEYIAYL